MRALLNAVVGKSVSRQRVGRLERVDDREVQRGQHGDCQHRQERGQPPVDAATAPAPPASRDRPLRGTGQHFLTLGSLDRHQRFTSRRCKNRNWIMDKTTITMKKMTAFAVW
jgi:hypothetical protein